MITRNDPTERTAAAKASIIQRQKRGSFFSLNLSVVVVIILRVTCKGFAVSTMQCTVVGWICSDAA